MFAKRDDVCGVGGVYVSELFAGQSDEGGQDEIGQDWSSLPSATARVVVVMEGDCEPTITRRRPDYLFKCTIVTLR